MNAVRNEFIPPNSDVWVAARRGNLGASRIYDATKRLKNGNYSEARETLMVELAIERLTGRATEHYVSAAMEWGIVNEPLAIAAYEWELGVSVSALGWIPHPTLEWTGCTPDGGIGTDGLIECKCPTSPTHVETLLTKEIDPKYLAQMHWQMACTGRKYCDFVSFDPRMPEHLQLAILRVERDEAKVKELETEAEKFLAELAEMMAKLNAA